MEKATTHHRSCAVVDDNVKKEIKAALKRLPTDLNQLYFKPWVGKQYGRAGFFGRKKVLALGESHYEWCPYCWRCGTKRGGDLTCRCIAERIVLKEEDAISHWRKIESALCGRDLDEKTRADFWHSIAYANYVQELVGCYTDRERADRPTGKMWESAQQPFLAMIKKLQPDLIVVLGFALWSKLPEEDKKLSKIIRGGKELERCVYAIGRGKNVIACRVRHPAAGLGITWNPAVKLALA